jgi:hypothetical protein
MAKIMAGYGIKVETDTGHFVWVTEDGTSSQKSKAIRFDSVYGAEMYRDNLVRNNPDVNLIVKKFSK